MSARLKIGIALVYLSLGLCQLSADDSADVDARFNQYIECFLGGNYEAMSVFIYQPDLAQLRNLMLPGLFDLYQKHDSSAVDFLSRFFGQSGLGNMADISPANFLSKLMEYAMNTTPAVKKLMAQAKVTLTSISFENDNNDATVDYDIEVLGQRTHDAESLTKTGGLWFLKFRPGLEEELSRIFKTVSGLSPGVLVALAIE